MPAGFVAGLVTPLATDAVGVLEALAAPGATRAAGGVAAGVSVLAASVSSGEFRLTGLSTPLTPP